MTVVTNLVAEYIPTTNFKFVSFDTIKKNVDEYLLFGSTSLSNVRHGSQLLIKPNLKEVLDYRLALSEEVYVPSVSQLSSQLSLPRSYDPLQADRMTIDECAESTKVCVGSVLAKILEIESAANWWYASCKNCVRKVEPVSKKYWCEECDGFVPVVPRFRVQVSAIDSTGSTSFVMFDRIVMQLIGKSASEHLGGASNKKSVPEILSIGDGTIGDPNDGVVSIEIPDDLLIKESADPLASIVNETYPSFLENMDDISYLQHRAILAPTNEIVDVVNDYMLSLVPKEMKTYLSFYSTCSANGSIDRPDDIHTPEFLNTINSSGLPNHELKLKEGVPVMLLRNIDQSSGDICSRVENNYSVGGRINSLVDIVLYFYSLHHKTPSIAFEKRYGSLS
ncbi:PREDICTED: uncharacterized protein LOC105973184 [Erythranthe guttata]|uniref:uncharacterized protein LOC105973184 n=1 Tax=Erythranthe guttata TaxID=4155 RepID=UPI00064DF72E|nr:PREDICTED: uncharacterized protein LOC105973184 [Erythranthe guttata]|eukprot:XP_012853659.1 PREDICTED: uncharacterized protein LOC105973184 [Erythranthe guttata]